MEKEETLKETLEECPSSTAQAGSANVCKGCPGKDLCKSQSKGMETEDESKFKVRMKAIKQKIIVLSGKGGVGKSTLTVQTAVLLSKKGFSVGILDLDLCGPSIPKLMNIPEDYVVVQSQYGWVPPKDPKYSIKVMSIQFLLNGSSSENESAVSSDRAVIWRGPRKTALILRFLKDTFWGRLDYLLIDTPPGTSDEHISVVSALTSSSSSSTAAVTDYSALLITTPQQLCKLTVCKSVEFCNKFKLKISGIVINMAGYTCPCCQEVTWILPQRTQKQEQQQQQQQQQQQEAANAKKDDFYGVKILGQLPMDERLTGECGGEIVNSGGTDKYEKDPVKLELDKIVNHFL